MGPVLIWGGKGLGRCPPSRVSSPSLLPLQGDDEDFSVVPTQSPSQVQRNLESRSQEEINRKVGGEEGSYWGAGRRKGRGEVWRGGVPPSSEDTASFSPCLLNFFSLFGLFPLLFLYLFSLFCFPTGDRAGAVLACERPEENPY